MDIIKNAWEQYQGVVWVFQSPFICFFFHKKWVKFFCFLGWGQGYPTPLENSLKPLEDKFPEEKSPLKFIGHQNLRLQTERHQATL